VVSLRVSAIGRLSKPAMPQVPAGEPTPPEAARRGSRLVQFTGHGDLLTAVYDRAALLAGNVIDGPAVIEEVASTTVVEPGDTVTVNPFGYLVMRLGGSGG
jgi:N-methylhydantoinase A